MSWTFQGPKYSPVHGRQTWELEEWLLSLKVSNCPCKVQWQSQLGVLIWDILGVLIWDILTMILIKSHHRTTSEALSLKRTCFHVLRIRSTHKSEQEAKQKPQLILPLEQLGTLWTDPLHLEMCIWHKIQRLAYNSHACWYYWYCKYMTSTLHAAD